MTIKKYREHKNFFFQEETQTWIKELDESDDGSGTSEMTSLDDFEVDLDSARGIISFPECNSPVSESTIVLRIIVLKILLTVTMKMNQLMPKVVYD